MRNGKIKSKFWYHLRGYGYRTHHLLLVSYQDDSIRGLLGTDGKVGGGADLRVKECGEVVRREGRVRAEAVDILYVCCCDL